jgi:hypothetical protein
MTWIGDVYSGWEWKWFDDWISKLTVRDEPANIGIVGSGMMSPGLYRDVQRSLANRFNLVDQPDIAAAKDALKRPRELSLVHSSCAVTRTRRTVCAGGATITTPSARFLRASETPAWRGVRKLAIDASLTLSGHSCPHDSLAGYVAVKFAGYWSDAFGPSTRTRAM